MLTNKEMLTSPLLNTENILLAHQNRENKMFYFIHPSALF